MQVIFPGTFDPPTRGHLDLISRGLALFGSVLVAVHAGTGAKKALFTVDERLSLLRAELGEDSKLEISSFSGLLVDFAKARAIPRILRGVRGAADLEYETQMMHMNRELWPDLEAVFLSAQPQYAFVRSSWVKEIAQAGGDLQAFVTPQVAQALQEKL